MTERRYQMVHVGPGDYLLPSNDGETLWRLYSYLEDGSAEVSADGKTWRKLRGTFWATAKYTREFPLPEKEDSDFLAWDDRWLQFHSGLKTRAEAISSALQAAAATRGP